MPELTNPALRLYDYLEHVTSWGHQFASRDWSVRQVWLGAIDIDPASEDPDEHFSGVMTEMLVLINSCEEIVKRKSTRRQDLHLGLLRRVKSALFGGGVQTWGQYRTTFSADFMTSLELVADNVSHYWYEEVIPAEELTEIQSDIDDLINRIVNSTLQGELRTVLIEGLVEVREAVLNYRVTGVDAIRKAVDSNIVAYGRNFDLIAELEDEEDEKMVRGFRNVIDKLNGIVYGAMKLKPLVKGIASLLSIEGPE